MKTKFRYPYKIVINFTNIRYKPESSIEDMECYIAEHFIYDYSKVFSWDWNSTGNRNFKYIFFFEDKKEAILFKTVFCGM